MKLLATSLFATLIAASACGTQTTSQPSSTLSAEQSEQDLESKLSAISCVESVEAETTSSINFTASRETGNFIITVSEEVTASECGLLMTQQIAGLKIINSLDTIGVILVDGSEVPKEKLNLVISVNDTFTAAKCAEKLKMIDLDLDVTSVLENIGVIAVTAKNTTDLVEMLEAQSCVEYVEEEIISFPNPVVGIR